MKKWILVFCAVLSISFFPNVWATNVDNQAAQSLIENWFLAMKNQQFDQAGNYLAPQFISIHTDGLVRDRNQEITLIKNLKMKNYTLGNFNFSPSGDAIVVTFTDHGAEQIDNKMINTQKAGRMAVLQKQSDKWMILAYANMDKIG
jgi:N-acetylglucosamine-6-phosphate deacetylase